MKDKTKPHGLKGRPHSMRGKGALGQWLKDRVNYAGDDCLKWPFFIDPRVGRGKLGYDGRMYWAHRLMCEFAHGPAPSPKHQAAHNCGNGHLACVNPRHLEWKTNRENSQDKIAHGTTRKPGDSIRLTPQQVAEIRARKGKQTQVSIAAEFGVSLSCVQYWQHGKERWPSHAGRAIQQKGQQS